MSIFPYFFQKINQDDYSSNKGWSVEYIEIYIIYIIKFSEEQETEGFCRLGETYSDDMDTLCCRL